MSTERDREEHMISRDDLGWPIRMHMDTRVCFRPNCMRGSGYGVDRNQPGPDEEFRIGGYCSSECEDKYELEQDIATLTRRCEMMEKALRELVEELEDNIDCDLVGEDYRCTTSVPMTLIGHARTALSRADGEK